MHRPMQPADLQALRTRLRRARALAARVPAAAHYPRAPSAADPMTIDGFPSIASRAKGGAGRTPREGRAGTASAQERDRRGRSPCKAEAEYAGILHGMQGLRLFRASAVVLLLCGIAHTIGHVTGKPQNEAEAALLQQMETTKLTMAGMTFSFRDVVDCLSWTMSVLTWAVAVLMLALRTPLASVPGAIARAGWIVATACAGLTAVALANSLLPPAVFYGAAGVLAALSAIRAR